MLFFISGIIFGILIADIYFLYKYGVIIKYFKIKKNSPSTYEELELFLKNNG